MKPVYFLSQFNVIDKLIANRNLSLKSCLLSVVILFFAASVSFGQGTATWTLTTSNTPAVCGNVTGALPTAGAGVAAVTSVNGTTGYSGTGFTTGLAAGNYSNTSTNYFQYAVTNTSAAPATFTSIRIGVYYNGPLYMYMAIRYSTDNFATSTLYTYDVQVNPGTATLTGTTNITVAAGATLRYRVYGYFTDGTSYRFGNTLFQVSATPLPPAAFSATPISGTQINLNGTANAAGNNVMLVFNTVNTFGVPAQGTNYPVSSTIPGGGTVLYVGAAGNPFFNHTGLIQGATYYYQLYSVVPACNLYSTPLATNAATICPAFTIPYSEGFNTSGPAVLPLCWTQQFVSGSAAITFQTASTNPTTNPQEGIRFVYWNSYAISTAGTQTRLVSPRINSTGTPSVNALFYWFHDNSAYTTATYATEGVTLEYSTNGTTWTNVQFIPRVLTGKNGWTVYDITLPIGAGNSPTLQVGFRFNSQWGNNCSMDNLLVYPTPTCKIPNSPITITGITTNAATISWAAATPAPAVGYDYYVTSSPVPPVAGTPPTGTTGPGVLTANLSGLNQNTDYYVWVRSRCSASDQSQWIGPGTFSTVSLYCTSTSSSGTYFLNQVAFVGLLQDVTQNSAYGVNGYQNFTGISPKPRQAQGQGVNVYLQSNFSVLMKAWVDWNGNAVFDDPSELVYTSNGILTSTTTFGFVIPLATVPGDYIMRVRTTYSGLGTYGPCGVQPNGETEDYVFTVVPTCSAQILAVNDGETCGPGPVTISAAGSTGTTEYNWYATATGGTPLATTLTGVWTTPSLSVTTIYYVTAYNGCESLVRTPVNAKVSTVPVLTFTPASPVVCGEGAVLQLNASGDTEEGILIFEKFNSGLGTFTLNNILINPAISTADAQWQNKANTYVPSNTTTWHPAISSGFGANNFVFSTSDLNPLINGTEVNTAMVSPIVNSTNYTSLALNFDIFFSHYLPDGTNTIIDSVNVEVSTDGGTNWTIVTTYITDQGIGTRFKNNTVPLNAYINQATLRIRFRYHGNWTDGVAIDNVKLSGSKPLSTSFSWSPTTGGNLFTDAAGLVPYTGGSVPNIYVRPTMAEIIAGIPLNFTATATLSNGCFASTPVSVQIGPSEWTGTVSNSWHNANNWCSKVVPTPTTIVIIPAGTPFSPSVTAAATAGRITIASGATLTISAAGSLAVRGDFINQGILANNGRIELNGAAVQTFPGATGTVTAMSILHINNTGAGVTLNKALSITNELRPTAGNLALGNNDITIRSQGVNTASVSTVGSSAGFTYGTGRFIVERYINTGTGAGQHRKSWQFLAAPTTGQTIKQSWMENAASPNANPKPGFGTQITGIAGTAGGFDATALLPSMKYYVPATNTWTEVGNPNSTAIHNTQGYFVFIRGDRSVINFSGANSAPVPTILRNRGTIDVGPVSSPPVTAGRFQSVGNPYPSAIDFSTITRTGGVDPNFYLFDPTLAGTQNLGGYQTITAATGYKATPGSTPLYNTTSNYKNIQSGEAFFVRATGSNGTLSFVETNKVTGSTLVNRPSAPSIQIPMFSTDIFKVNGNTTDLADGNRVVFDNFYRNVIDGYDAVKISNDVVNFGMSRDGVILAVEARRRLKSNDTIFYNFRGGSVGSYILRFTPEHLRGHRFTGYLVDQYLNTRTFVSLLDTSLVNFSVTQDPGSAVANRFYLVFHDAKNDLFSRTEFEGDRTVKNSNESETIRIYPNPVVGRKLNIEFRNHQTGIYKLQITGNSGQLIYNRPVTITGKNQVFAIELNNSTAAGIYQLSITGETNVSHHQLVLP